MSPRDPRSGFPSVDLDEVVSRLGAKRPVFHSEADFQHALGWEIHSSYPGCAMRLEYRASRCQGRPHVDLWASDEVVTAVELKYKTRKAFFSQGGVCCN